MAINTKPYIFTKVMNRGARSQHREDVESRATTRENRPRVASADGSFGASKLGVNIVSRVQQRSVSPSPAAARIHSCLQTNDAVGQYLPDKFSNRGWC